MELQHFAVVASAALTIEVAPGEAPCVGIYEEVFEHMPDATGVTVDGVFTHVNAAWERMFGWNRAEVIGHHVLEFGMWADANLRDQMMRRLMVEGVIEHFELTLRVRDGRSSVCHGSMRLIDVGGGKRGALFACRDMTEQVRLRDALQARNAEMEQFVYTVSHDLKSPLVTIKGFLGSVEDGLARGDHEEVRSDLARIGSAADRMTRLLEDLLELSRVGRIAAARVDVRLDEIVDDALEAVFGSLRSHHVEVVRAGALPAASGDRGRLTQVVQNLIENAAKYMGDQAAPRIEIGTADDPERALLYVRDNGIGIEPRHHERVFGLFDKVDPRSEGTGVGLSLVRRIIEFHGGTAWVESAGAGQGSTFWVALPRHPMR